MHGNTASSTSCATSTVWTSRSHTIHQGASKWNPIEHRLFSEISKNWAGRPLDSYETILNFIRTTKTKTGLKVNARLVKKQYPKGIKISDPAMALLNIKKSSSLPKWNYTLRPSKNGK